ncbi:MAG: TrkH family potassium uptake protein [Rhodospirillaceae bacterium]|nr:TrkH family potassium uptake protein [Rhodospirillaceae bacterium]
MPDLRPILHINGILLTGLAVLMLVPAIADLAADNDDWFAFWASSIATGFFGLALMLANRQDRITLNLKQAFLLTTLAWVLTGAFGALPFMFAEVNLNYTGAFFEATSGLTTTGSSVLVGLDAMPPGILLWRSLLSFIGGLGIIVLAVAILPLLRVGGMQLLRTESSDRMDKVLPRAREISIATGSVYVALNVACMFGYWLNGMSGFDALNHAMTTVATAGFSTSDSSLSKWPGAGVLWNGTIFMFLGSLPFTLYLRALKGNWRELVMDEQVRLFAAVVMTSAVAITIWHASEDQYDVWDGFQHSLFNVVSVASTTGYMSADYAQWGTFPVLVFAVLLLLGGCTGSTAGGVKALRYVVLWEMLKAYVRQLVTPHGVFQQRYNGRPVPADVPLSVVAFVAAYLGALGIMTLMVAAHGIDPMTSYSAVAACLGNVGPGLGEIVGPAGNFRSMPDSVIWILSFAMILGRLELFTVLVLLTRHFWRA